MPILQHQDSTENAQELELTMILTKEKEMFEAIRQMGDAQLGGFYVYLLSNQRATCRLIQFIEGLKNIEVDILRSNEIQLEKTINELYPISIEIEMEKN